jgi:hypothetical protein
MHHNGRDLGEYVQQFYPSLYLNMGKAHEDLGNLKDARRFYALAAQRIGCLPESLLKILFAAVLRMACNE